MGSFALPSYCILGLGAYVMMRSWRYFGAVLFMQLYANTAVLYWMHCWFLTNAGLSYNHLDGHIWIAKKSFYIPYFATFEPCWFCSLQFLIVSYCSSPFLTRVCTKILVVSLSTKGLILAMFLIHIQWTCELVNMGSIFHFTTQSSRQILLHQWYLLLFL